jgi:hypothetical protein
MIQVFLITLLHFKFVEERPRAGRRLGILALAAGEEIPLRAETCLAEGRYEVRMLIHD